MLMFLFSVKTMFNAGDDNEEQLLIEKIHDQIRQIRQCKVSFENNCYLTGINSPIDKALVENNSFRLILDDKLLTDCTITKLNPVDDLYNDLKDELEHICQDLGRLVKRIKDFKDTFIRQEHNSENLQLMLRAPNNNETSLMKWDVLEKNIKQRFIKEKRDLKTIMERIFPENLEIRDLIAEITHHYFSEGADKYFRLENTDNITDQIELLIQTELFEVNPHNSLEIKLADII